MFVKYVGLLRAKAHVREYCEHGLVNANLVPKPVCWAPCQGLLQVGANVYSIRVKTGILSGCDAKMFIYCALDLLRDKLHVGEYYEHGSVVGNIVSKYVWWASCQGLLMKLPDY